MNIWSHIVAFFCWNMSHILEHSIVESADALLILFHWTGIPLPPMRAQCTDLRTVCVSAFILQTCWNEVTLRYYSFCFPPSSRFNFEVVTWEKLAWWFLIRVIKTLIIYLPPPAAPLSLSFSLISPAFISQSLPCVLIFSCLFQSGFLFHTIGYNESTFCHCLDGE